MAIEISSVHLNLLVEEVLVQTDLALRSYDNLLKLISAPETRQHRECWGHIQSLLSHSAMISKYIDPSSKSDVSKARSATLRATLEIKDGSAVLRRDARNNLEHLDERLDSWMLADAGKLLEMAFENRRGYEYLNKSNSDGHSRWFVKRVYLIEEGVFISQGRKEVQEIEVKSLVNELKRIQNCAEYFLSADRSITRLHPL